MRLSWLLKTLQGVTDEHYEKQVGTAGKSARFGQADSYRPTFKFYSPTSNVLLSM
jgi:hypothetical protein